LTRDNKFLIFLILNIVVLGGSLIVGFADYIEAERRLMPEIILDEEVLISHGSAYISVSDRWAYSPIIFCDTYYFQINFLHFIEGSHWHESEEELPLIILNEALAWYLFGGKNITGLTVNMGGYFYRIIGVVREGSNYMAWMPSNNGYIEIEANRSVAGMGVLHRILLYAIWLYIMVMLFKRGIPFKIVALLIFVMLINGVNDILLWLPGQSLFQYANYAWLVGIVSFINLIFLYSLYSQYPPQHATERPR